MNITTSNHWVGLYSMTRTDFYIKESQLKLMEVPLNASTRFQCTGNDGEYSKVISFSVKGKFVNYGITKLSTLIYFLELFILQK